MSIIADIDRVMAERRELFLDTLFRLARQPSISSQGVGIAECAELVRSVLEENGIPARLMPTAGAPIVYGEIQGAPGAGTMLIYGHYDVQPPEPYEAWVSPPFEPTVRDGRIYGRGVGDNKGQFLAHILAVKVLSELGQMPQITLKVLLEGEEESSSKNLLPFIQQHAEMLKADLLYNADGPMPMPDRPAIDFGHRGVLTMELEATGANRDLHSGQFGGPMPHPVWNLVDLLSTMRLPDGRVAVEGFYQDVLAPSEYERQLMARIPFDEKALKKNMDVEEWAGPKDLPYLEKLLFQPTLNIQGISSGYTGKGSKTAIPSKAILKLECRLAANQDPDDIFARIERHVARYGSKISIRKLGSTKPAKTPADLPVSQMLIGAIGDAYGVAPIVRPMRGSSNPEYMFVSVLKLPSVTLTYGPHDENNHAPNENITIDSFFNGIRASALVINRFGALSRAELGK